MDLLQKLERVEREFPEHLKGALKRMPFVFQGYIGAEMNYQDYRKDGKYPKNNTDTLNIRSSALFKSFLPKNKNNFFEESGQGFTLGSKLKYAAIHEYGGTINHPGGTPYIVMSGKGARFMKKDGQYPDSVKFTKPHPITIKARPYFRPAEKKLMGEGMLELQNKVMQQIAAIINE